MIQRIQTLWFALAAGAGIATTQLPLFSTTLTNGSPRELLATESLLLFAILIGLALMALFCIFLYKNRPLQFKLGVLGVVISIITVALEVYFIEQFKIDNPITKGTYQWGGLFPILMIIFFFLAAKGVYKDEKLVKSLDRLR